MGGMHGDIPEQFQSFFDIFAGQGGSNASSKKKNTKGQSMEYTMKITLEEAYNGGLKKFKHKRNRICMKCDGKGGMEVNTCQHCDGKGMVSGVNQFGPGMFQHTNKKCPKCNGKGRKVTKKCPKCRGKKVIRKMKTIEVPFEPGVPNDFVYILTGEADEAPYQIAGDLHVIFNIKKHKVF